MTDTLKSTYEQCTKLHNPQLEFIPEGFRHHREIILRDLRELVSAACLEQEKTVVILAGCVFESILYVFIQAQIDYISIRRGGAFNFNPEDSLGNFISVFNKYFSSGPDAVPDLVAKHRDMIHINRELSAPTDACRNASRDMLHHLNRLIGQLAAFARP